MLNGVIRSFVFGVTLAAAVGPIAFLIINYGINAGMRPAAAACLGAALADFSYALVAFTIGSVVLERLVGHAQALRLASASILIILGLYLIARAARTSRDTAGAAARGGSTMSRLISRPSWIRALNAASGAAIVAFGIFGLIGSF